MKMKIFYIKTTETCNLNCSHCFTSGKNGRKIYFNPVTTAAFVNNFTDEEVHIDYHGGEPFLAPLEDMRTFYKLVSAKNKKASFGVTTNLTFKLTEDKISFIQNELSSRIATSWDEGIRWANTKQYDLWKNNVRKLISLGVTVKVFVSMNVQLMKREPLDVLNIFRELGIREVAFERLTHDGSAERNPHIFPTNGQIDDWIWEMHKVNDREWFDNNLLESVYTKFEDGDIRSSTFCRKCEKIIFTVNADGTIAGCPNSAPSSHYAHVSDDISSILNHDKRSCMIAAEAHIDPRCISCKVFGECGGDCYKLEWDETHCPAPKKLMYALIGEPLPVKHTYDLIGVS
jgi:radical SAM protein with 4Fe4S-binding SPASM domain